MSKSLEDYLKGIYLLKKRKQYSNKNLAEYLNISPASVSEMIKKLSNENYLISEGRNIKLTKKGSDIAVNIIRKHRVWEVFLVEKLGYDKDEIHEEAEVLEHVTSEKLLQKLEKFLFYPKECPHGSPIFYDSDEFSEENMMKLRKSGIKIYYGIEGKKQEEKKQSYRAKEKALSQNIEGSTMLQNQKEKENGEAGENKHGA